MARIHVIDAKFGRHKVEAKDNLQMICYALGSIEKFKWLADFDEVMLTIVQPFLHHVDTWTTTVAHLREVEEFMRVKAEETRTNPQFAPSADNCHFCKAAPCAANTKMVLEACGFEDVPMLGDQYKLVPLVQQWATKISEQVFAKLEAGEQVLRSDGEEYVLQDGRKGRRAWRDEDIADTHLLRYGDDAYNRKLKTPPQIEKLAKADGSWGLLQGLIEQPGASKSIGLKSESRTALPKADFDDVPFDNGLF